MMPIMRDGKSLAVVDVGVTFGKEFVDRAKQRFGIDLAVHWFDGKSFKRLSSTFGDAVVATQDELKSVFDGAALHRDASSAAIPPRVYVGQIKNYAGQPVAVLEIIKDTSEYEAAAAVPSATCCWRRWPSWPAPSCWRSCSAAACRGRWSRSPQS